MLGLIAAPAVPKSLTLMMHGTNALTTVPFMLSVGAALSAIYLGRSATVYSGLAKRYTWAAISSVHQQGRQNPRPHQRVTPAQQTRRLGSMRSTF